MPLTKMIICFNLLLVVTSTTSEDDGQTFGLGHKVLWADALAEENLEQEVPLKAGGLESTEEEQHFGVGKRTDEIST